MRRALGVDVLLGADVVTVARRAALDDLAPFRPPHPSLSLTHAGTIAVAAGVGRRDRSRIGGLGVDYEPASRCVSARAARLFLDDIERTRVDGHPEPDRSAARLALWTVKEAVYKATPDNGTHTVAAYHVREDGTARLRDLLEFRHVTVRFAEGFLSVAVLDLSAAATEVKRVAS